MQHSSLARVLAATAAAVLLFLLIPTAAQAAPERSSAPVRHCITVVDKDPETNLAEVVSQDCSTDRGQVERAQKQAMATCGCTVPLVTFYGEDDFQGLYNTVYGRYGTCDSSGYGFSDLRGVYDNVSGIESYELYGACTVSQRFTEANFSGTASTLIWGQRQSYIGIWANNMRSFWVLAG